MFVFHFYETLVSLLKNRCQTPLKKDTDDIALDSEEKGPDIIPANINTRQHFIINGKLQC